MCVCVCIRTAILGSGDGEDLSAMSHRVNRPPCICGLSLTVLWNSGWSSLIFVSEHLSFYGGVIHLFKLTLENCGA